MGVAVSGWALARSVSLAGQLGVVSGTAVAVMLARRLQLGDPGGHLRRALRQFPFPEMAARVLAAYFIEGGKAPDAPFKPMPMPVLQPSSALVELTVAANFAEVFLAKEGHDGVVGINFLEKIQLPTLPSLFGAMLAGVDYVLMGAGIPRTIPGILDRFAEGAPAELRIDVAGTSAEEAFHSTFVPRAFCGGIPPRLHRPQFLGIISSATLGMTLARKSSGRVDGFVVEGPTAGGHNAPPRGILQLSPEGEPVYGPRDVPELDKIHALGLPFWLAGSYGRPGKLAEARALGATGVQVGTAFAFCEESGMTPELKEQVLQLSRIKQASVFTDPLASPTGFPIKVAQLKGTISEAEKYAARTRICDLGYLRHPYRMADGSVGYRCPAEPPETYLSKGGTLEDTRGRKCICNGLPAAVGLGQIRPDGRSELPFVTAGDDLAMLATFLKPGRASYTAREVLQMLLGHEDEAPVDSGSSTPG
ncbi:MAG TPA: nitronate monooxygenase [Candidatus Ozemobacteraceae bacterium]|nr:nitronate monooxygenase [Candidatus Ozemobacteraceae bacterium]